MAIFSRKKYIPASTSTSPSFTTRLGTAYRSKLHKHPFLLFGLPFIATIVLGSFVLTPATAMRYESYDHKVRRMTHEEAMGLGKDRKKVDIREEYFRLSARDSDNWENKRVERLKGEHNGILE